MSLLTLFIASLLGSLHCAGMCGGFAAYCAGAGSRPHFSSAAYNLGRLVTYVALGFGAGIFGRRLDALLSQSGVSNAMALLVGFLLIVWGSTKLFGLSPRGVGEGKPLRGSLHQRVFSSIVNLAPLPRSLCIGLLSTLLPCAWLYAFVALAAASGSGLQGSIIMFVFWLGTVPVFAALGVASRQILQRWGAQVPALTASLLIASGLFCILGHLGIVHVHSSHEHAVVDDQGSQPASNSHHHHHGMNP